LNSSSFSQISNNSIQIVGVCGGSGSGKTTLCQGFAETFHEPVTFLGLDRYYRDQSHLPPQERAQINFDHPDALEIELLWDHLDQLRQGRSLECPEYDYVTHQRKGYSKVCPGKIVLLEGIHVLTHAETRSRLDYKVFLDTPDDIRLLRRIRRDLKERQRTLDSVEEQYLNQTRPMYLQYIEPNKSKADVILDGCQPVNLLVDQMCELVSSYLSLGYLSID